MSDSRCGPGGWTDSILGSRAGCKPDVCTVTRIFPSFHVLIICSGMSCSLCQCIGPCTAMGSVSVCFVEAACTGYQDDGVGPFDFCGSCPTAAPSTFYRTTFSPSELPTELPTSSLTSTPSHTTSTATFLPMTMAPVRLYPSAIPTLVVPVAVARPTFTAVPSFVPTSLPTWYLLLEPSTQPMIGCLEVACSINGRCVHDNRGCLCAKCVCKAGFHGNDCAMPVMRLITPSASVTELGLKIPIRLELLIRPTDTVQCLLSTSNSSEGAIVTKPAQLTFSSTADVPIFYVAGVADYREDGNRTFFARVGPCSSSDIRFAIVEPLTVQLLNIDVPHPIITETKPQIAALDGDLVTLTGTNFEFGCTVRVNQIHHERTLHSVVVSDYRLIVRRHCPRTCNVCPPVPKTDVTTACDDNNVSLQAASEGKLDCIMARKLCQIQDRDANESSLWPRKQRRLPEGQTISSNATANVTNTHAAGFEWRSSTQMVIVIPPSNVTMLCEGTKCYAEIEIVLLLSGAASPTRKIKDQLQREDTSLLIAPHYILQSNDCPHEGMFGVASRCRACPNGALADGHVGIHVDRHMDDVAMCLIQFRTLHPYLYFYFCRTFATLIAYRSMFLT